MLSTSLTEYVWEFLNNALWDTIGKMRCDWCSLYYPNKKASFLKIHIDATVFFNSNALK